MDSEQLLRPHRKDLVIAAESAIRESRDKPEKSQLNRLVSICSEATCTEEIANYLLYQSSRQTRPWPKDFTKLIIDKIEAPLRGISNKLQGRSEADCDRVRIAAWRLYAVFLVRASTYAKASQKDNGHGHARR